LQLVEQGAITLDEPIYRHLPELRSLPLITHGSGNQPFTLSPVTKNITLRHLLSHTSGLASEDHPLISDYLSSDVAKVHVEPDAPQIVQYFSNPLIFEPGEGFEYGHSIYWTQLLVARLGGNFTGYVQEHIFDRIGMTSSTYQPNERADIYDRRLQMVERQNGNLVPADGAAHGLIASASDMGIILSDLVSSEPRILSPGSIELLFTGQLAPSTAALASLRGNDDNYAFCAGRIGRDSPPSVNWSLAGLLAEDVLPVSQMPKGTVTWEGMPNVLWAVNREKKLGMFFGTQLVPVGDEIANGLALMFMRDAWNKFTS
jgi:CubicO group peptidase (beta-lactamase class C family)